MYSTRPLLKGMSLLHQEIFGDPGFSPSQSLSMAGVDIKRIIHTYLTGATP